MQCLKMEALHMGDKYEHNGDEELDDWLKRSTLHLVVVECSSKVVGFALHTKVRTPHTCTHSHP